MLVIVLSEVESRRWDKRSHDRLFEAARLFQCKFELLCQALLLIAVIKDGRMILCWLALIAELPGSVEWVDIAPEDLQQARIVYFNGILDYFDCFSVSHAAR